MARGVPRVSYEHFLHWMCLIDRTSLRAWQNIVVLMQVCTHGSVLRERKLIELTLTTEYTNPQIDCSRHVELMGVVEIDIKWSWSGGNLPHPSASPTAPRPWNPELNSPENKIVVHASSRIIVHALWSYHMHGL